MAERATELDALFAALADPTRRAVVYALRDGAATATELVDEFTVTRQAIVKHLGVLERCGLVEAARDGRDVRYRLTPAPFAQAMSWMVEVGAEWDLRLARLAKLVDQTLSSPGARPPR